MAIVSRNPFARTELHREVVIPADGETCACCGGLNATGKLYQYRIERDGLANVSVKDKRRFCSKPCRDGYYS